MKSYLTNSIKALLLSLALFSCTARHEQVAFTSDIQGKYGFTKKQLEKVQFYTSGEIILLKTDIEDNAAITNGKVIVVDKQSSEKIIIPKGTPCVLMDILDQNKFLFRFEYGDGRVILFGNNGGGNYSLMAKNWKMKYGTIKYAGKNYVTGNGDVYLTISAHKLRKLKSRERTLGGMVVR